MSDKKIELIAQLLAKAEQTTPQEAEALTEHAERLMIKYGIEQAVINERRAKSGTKSEEIVKIMVTFKGAYRLEMVRLGHSICVGLGTVNNLMSTVGNKEANLYIIGFESDVEQAKVLIESLQVQGLVAIRAWWKLNKADFSMESSYDQEAARRSFLSGFGSGAGRRIGANRQHAVHEAGTGTELVLVSRKAQVDTHMSSLATGKNRARGGKGSATARNSGYEAGQQANTGEKSMTQGRGINA